MVRWQRLIALTSYDMDDDIAVSTLGMKWVKLQLFFCVGACQYEEGSYMTVMKRCQSSRFLSAYWVLNLGRYSGLVHIGFLTWVDIVDSCTSLSYLYNNSGIIAT